MDATKREDKLSIVESEDSSLQPPFIYEDEETVSLYFQIDSVQSRMREDAPDDLVLSYTRTMTAFLLHNWRPQKLAMIGLGGGSMAKWCYRSLPRTDITVVEINPHVIALRDRFYIPQDDERFRVLCEDGADYILRTSNQLDVLLVDGFDIDGQPPQLCSQNFYDDCYEALTPSGIMVVNLCSWEDRTNLGRIRKSFADRVLAVKPEDSSNHVVFASKSEPVWQDERRNSFLMNLKGSKHMQQV